MTFEQVIDEIKRIRWLCDCPDTVHRLGILMHNLTISLPQLSTIELREIETTNVEKIEKRNAEELRRLEWKRL